MDDLVTWLRAQLDDDEHKIAAMEREENRVQTAPIFQGHPPNWLAGVDIFVSSERWRAEVDAKRRLLDWLVDCENKALDGNWWNLDVEAAIKLLALPFADRPGYQGDWQQ